MAADLHGVVVMALSSNRTRSVGDDIPNSSGFRVQASCDCLHPSGAKACLERLAEIMNSKPPTPKLLDPKAPKKETQL